MTQLLGIVTFYGITVLFYGIKHRQYYWMNHYMVCPMKWEAPLNNVSMLLMVCVHD
jgi:hypothetical protein